MSCRICKKEFLGPDDVVKVEACKFLDPSENSFEFSTRYDIMEANCVMHLDCFMSLLNGEKETDDSSMVLDDNELDIRKSVERTQALGFFT